MTQRPVYEHIHGWLWSKWYAEFIDDDTVELTSISTGRSFILPKNTFLKEYHIVNSG